jgi:4a-hydroxytetrahydrobiopterin dehydratase
MKTAPHLSALHCIALEGSNPLSTEDIIQQLIALPTWQHESEFLRRTYEFGNYYETIAFVNALAFMVHREDHHPDLTVTYNRCTVKFNTHSVGGISQNDFICAAKADAIFAHQFA